MIRNRQGVAFTGWGAGCEAWELVGSPDLSVKHERMPPGTREVRHHHAKAQQFFFVLSGVLKIELDGEVFELHPQDGLSVLPPMRHQAINDGDAPVEFLVISSPPTSDDRIE